MIKLVLAEKPSVAKSLSAVLGANTKKDGYFEGGGYIVSWAVGHLLGLAPPDAYGEHLAKWNIADLPILPDPWIYKPNESTKKQLKVLKELLNRSDVDGAINGCDAGREGELIFRLVYGHCKCKKPVERLWISSMEESAIADGFKKLCKGADYDSLYQAALCRQQADWAFGINYSRLFGCLYNVKGLSVGRVQTPTLAMIVEREGKIKAFVKEPFYTVELEGAGFTAASERVKDKAQAEAIAAKCNGRTAVVKSVVKQQKSISAPKLYDLTTMQREANRLFGYSAKQTLEYAQSLYEKKMLTYPRTDSRFLTEDMRENLPMLAASVGTYMPMFAVDTADKEDYNFSQIIDNSKVTDHHAIIPTMEAANTNLDSAPGEKNILMMAASRLLSAVAPKHEYAETIVTVDCEGAIFTAKGKTVIRDGWKYIEDTFMSVYGNKKSKETAENSLPSLTQDQSYTASTNLKEGWTSPPKPFTEDTLLSAMENATADDMPENFQAERNGIGTPATRADIIETLLKREYAVRKDKQILPTEKGIGVIKILPDADSIKSPMLTAQWESDLNRVETGELSADEFMAAINAYVCKAVSENRAVPEDKKLLFASSAPGGGEVLGRCPRCGNDITETPKAFSCVNRQCKFCLWKDAKFFSAKKKELKKAVVITLLTEGRIFMQGLHSEKTGKPYNATIILTDDKPDSYPSYTMEFEKK